jgi:hypothetical protein
VSIYFKLAPENTSLYLRIEALSRLFPGQYLGFGISQKLHQGDLCRANVIATPALDAIHHVISLGLLKHIQLGKDP